MTIRGLLLSSCTALLAFVLSSPAHAQRDETEQAFERFEESLQPRVEDGDLAPQGIGPILLVGATPAFEVTQAWFPVAALEATARTFGAGNVRLCEACMSPRVSIEDGRLEHNSVLSLPEIARVDEELRGDGRPARSALWLEETPGGIAVRLVRIDNGQVLFAGNFDGGQTERIRTSEIYNATLELGRRLRGESLTHVIIDLALLPNQHLSLDIAEQFGDSNKNLAGVTFSLFDPVFGVGVAYYRIIPAAFDLTVGAQVIASLPTAIVTALPGGTPGDLIDPLITGVLVARWPIPSTNFAITGMVSTNFTLAFGVSLLNVQLLPFLP